jgi:hypothetical protein
VAADAEKAKTPTAIATTAAAPNALHLQTPRADRIAGEIPVLDKDGKPTGAIKMLKTGFDGMQGYFEWLGLNNPRSFAALLGRVLPTQLNIKTSSTSLKVTYKTSADANKALRERGITDVMVSEILKLEAPKKK